MSFQRNTNKSEALDAKIFAVFLVKVVCDASSRITFFGAFMYTVNSGQFSTKMILIYYYGMVFINILINSCFSLLDKKEDKLSLRKFIGKDFFFSCEVQLNTCTCACVRPSVSKRNFSLFVQLMTTYESV